LALQYISLTPTYRSVNKHALSLRNWDEQLA